MLRNLMFVLLLGQSPLQPGVPVEGRLGADQTRTYNVTLKPDQFVKLIVEQHGIDIGLHVTAPDGQPVGDYEGAAAFVADIAGDYVIQVLPLDAFRKPSPGQYNLRVEELRNATPAELRNLKPRESLRTKGVVLANEILNALPEIRNFKLRTDLQIQTADLFWTIDDKFAWKLYSRVIDTIGAPTSDSAEFGELREQLFDSLKEHDSVLALQFVRSVRNPWIWPQDDARERNIELSLAKALAPNNPKLALTIAEDSLADGLFPDQIQAVKILRPLNPEMAARLSHQILTKLLDAPLLSTPANAKFTHDFAELLRTPGKPALASEAESSNLVQKLFSELDAYQQSQPLIAIVQKHAAQTLVSALKEFNVNVHPAGLEPAQNLERTDAVVSARSSRAEFSRAPEMLERIEAMAPDDRSMYDLKKAVSNLGVGLKRTTALALLERARSLLPSSSRAEDDTEMEARFALAKGYARVDINRAFEIAEPLVEQINEMLSAARLLNGFGQNYFADGDYVLDSNNLSDTVDGLFDVLGNLAMVNFQRAKSAADRLRTPTVRVQTYLHMARRALGLNDNDD